MFGTLVCCRPVVAVPSHALSWRHTGLRATPREKKSGAPKGRDLEATWLLVRHQIVALSRREGIPGDVLSVLDALATKEKPDQLPAGVCVCVCLCVSVCDSVSLCLCVCIVQRK